MEEQTLKEKLLTLYKMQDDIDQAIYKEHYKPELNQIEIAMWTEIGEVLQAAKGNWCWWKKTQKPVNQAELLEEVADVLHFALMLEIEDESLFDVNVDDEEFLPFAYQTGIFEKRWKEKPETEVDVVSIAEAMESFFNYISPVISTLWLAHELGFTSEQLYQAYLTKNAKNYERLKNGY